LGTVLACDYRADLAAAGKGGGRCAFSFVAPRRLTPEIQAVLEVRRAADQVALHSMRESQAASEPQIPADPAPKLRLVG
jgi:hypothetical protein